MARADVAAVIARTTRKAQVMAKRYAEANMTAQGTIYRTDAPAFNPVNGALTVVAGDPVYSGKMGITTESGGLAGAYGDEPQATTSGEAYIPLDAAGPMVNDILVVEAHPDDQMLIGRAFQITDVGLGGRLTASRRLSLSGAQPSRQWRRT